MRNDLTQLGVLLISVILVLIPSYCIGTLLMFSFLNMSFGVKPTFIPTLGIKSIVTLMKKTLDLTHFTLIDMFIMILH